MECSDLIKLHKYYLKQLSILRIIIKQQGKKYNCGKFIATVSNVFAFVIYESQLLSLNQNQKECIWKTDVHRWSGFVSVSVRRISISFQINRNEL
jgi:hypothetical protein